MPEERDRPTLRGFVKTVWPIISNRAGRGLKKMRHVRPELMRVVYSHLTDAEGADRMRSVVRSDPQAARVTLAYVARIRESTYEYETDRAYRILVAAMNNSPPAGVRREDAELFEQQRALGWSTLGDAFDQLASAAPELSEIAQSVKSGNPTSEWAARVDDLVGPRSSSADPLLRSFLAATVVARYLGVVGGRGGRERLGHPVWP